MITTKERAVLKGIAMKMNAQMQIGKDGITDNVVAQLEELLYNKELVKINVLKNCDYNAKEALEILCEKLNAQPVQAIGNKAVIYKYSNKKDINHVL